MKSTFKLLCLFFLATVWVNCESDDGDGTSLEGTNISISDIQGAWDAIRAEFDIAGSGLSQSIDIIEEGGSGTLNIQSNGRFTLTLVVPGQGTDIITGQLSFDEDLLVVEFDDSPGESEFFSIQNTSTTLSLSGPAEFDLDNDGTDDSAIATLDFVRS